MVKPSAHLLEYLANQNIDITNITEKLTDRPFEEMVNEAKDDHDDTSIPKTEAGVPVPYSENTNETQEQEISIMPSDNSEQQTSESVPTEVQNSEQVQTNTPVENSASPDNPNQVVENQQTTDAPVENNIEVPEDFNNQNNVVQNNTNQTEENPQVSNTTVDNNVTVPEDFNNINNQVTEVNNAPGTVVSNDVLNNMSNKVIDNGQQQPQEFKPAVINTISIDDILGKES